MLIPTGNTKYKTSYSPHTSRSTLNWFTSILLTKQTEFCRNQSPPARNYKHCMVSHIPSHLKQEENNLSAGIKPTNHPYSLSFTTHWKTEGWLDFKQLIVSSNENYLPSISTCWYWYSYCAQNCNKTPKNTLLFSEASFEGILSDCHTVHSHTE